MAALKKAYADIILNTAKEAAARVLVEERKADGYLRDLAAVKEDALSMLVRLKRVMDSKVLALLLFGSFLWFECGFWSCCLCFGSEFVLFGVSDCFVYLLFC